LVGLARDPGQATKIKATVDLDEVKAKTIMEYDGKILDETSGGQEDAYGLGALRERVEMLGGTFDYSAKAGQGTYIILEFPIAE
jgi:signal transduction histidine kinase